MAQIGNILNLVMCGLSAAIGTGTKGCKPFFRKVSEIWLTPQGFVFDKARDLDGEYLQELQSKGDLIVLKGVRTFTDNSSDDQIETLEDQTEQVTALGLYKFTAEFVNGLYFNAALNSLNSFGQYDMIFVDIDGNILGTKAQNGSLKGFTTGMIQAARLKWATDTQMQREGLSFQFLKRYELDSNYVFIQKQDDFDPRLLDGINEVVLSLTPPVNAETTATVKAVRKQDGHAFVGASYTDFLFTESGATNNPTAGDDSVTPGTYVLTGFTAFSTGNPVTSRLYDNAENVIVISNDGDLYKSNIATATVV